MPKNIRTHIYCLDGHRSFTDEIRKKFDDTTRYIVDSFHTGEDLSTALERDKESKACKIVIIGIRDMQGELQETEKLADCIRKKDPRTGVVVLCPPEKLEDIGKKTELNVDAFIPQNANFILRVHNTVKKIFSEYNIVIHRERRNRSLMAVLAFVILSVMLILFARLKYPDFF
mgnify:CR=1 FL=1